MSQPSIDIRAKVQEVAGELVVSAYGEVARCAVPKELVAWMREEGLAVQRAGSNVYDVAAECELIGNLLHVRMGLAHRVVVLDAEKASRIVRASGGEVSLASGKAPRQEGLWTR